MSYIALGGGNIATAAFTPDAQQSTSVQPSWLAPGSVPSWLEITNNLDGNAAGFALTESGLYVITAQLVARSHVELGAGDSPANFVVNLALDFAESGGTT